MSLTGRKADDLLNINQWVKEATEGKIEDFLSELPDDTVLLLLNAIHFQGAFLLSLGPPPQQPPTPAPQAELGCENFVLNVCLSPQGGARRQGALWVVAWGRVGNR